MLSGLKTMTKGQWPVYFSTHSFQEVLTRLISHESTIQMGCKGCIPCPEMEMTEDRDKRMNFKLPRHYRAPTAFHSGVGWSNVIPKSQRYPNNRIAQQKTVKQQSMLRGLVQSVQPPLHFCRGAARW